MPTVNGITKYPATVSQYLYADGTKAEIDSPAYDVNSQATVQDALSDQLQTLLAQGDGPITVDVTGKYASDPSGAVFSLGIAGQVYKDGVRMPGLAASKFVLCGLSLYAHGRTDGKWWKWVGTGWGAVAGEVDPTILP